MKKQISILYLLLLVNNNIASQDVADKKNETYWESFKNYINSSKEWAQLKWQKMFAKKEKKKIKYNCPVAPSISKAAPKDTVNNKKK